MEIFETAGIDVPEVEPKYDFWMVMAYWKSSPGGWWKIFPDQWKSKERALEQVAIIQKSGWRFVKLLHITNREDAK
jgi:hypothetical protein